MNGATRHRDLHSGRSLWTEARPLATTPLVHHVEADVVVVGAGISGACMAYALASAGHSVIVLDRRRSAALGSTTASTSLIASEIDRALFDLSRRIGRSRAERAWTRSFAAVERLRAIVRKEDIRCQWGDRSSLYVAGSAYGWRALGVEVRARAKAGLSGEFVDQATLKATYGIDRTGAILSQGSAVANPVRLSAGLLRRAVRLGARVFAPVEVIEAVPGSRGLCLRTGSSFLVFAGNVVFCTGYELLRGIPAAGHAVKSTWALASEPGAVYPAWLNRTVVWEASEPYAYLRTSVDGRLIAGGEDEVASSRHRDRALLGRKAGRIAATVRDLLPGASFTVAHRWGGAFGESATGLPFIDRAPGLPGCWVVMGFGGNGITYGMIASEVIPALLAGRRDPDADLYRLS